MVLCPLAGERTEVPAAARVARHAPASSHSSQQPLSPFARCPPAESPLHPSHDTGLVALRVYTDLRSKTGIMTRTERTLRLSALGQRRILFAMYACVCITYSICRRIRYYKQVYAFALGQRRMQVALRVYVLHIIHVHVVDTIDR